MSCSTLPWDTAQKNNELVLLFRDLVFPMEKERGQLVSHSMEREVQGNLVSLFPPKAPHSTAQHS